MTARQSNTILIKRERLRSSFRLTTDQLKLDFGLPDAASPKELGYGNDERKLGIFVKSISFGSLITD